VEVTEETASSWLDWLAKEHESDFPKIRAQVERMAKKRLQAIAIWEDLSEEQRTCLRSVLIARGSKA
jgi:hypothetical protein